jgi:hypothetical protein
MMRDPESGDFRSRVIFRPALMQPRAVVAFDSGERRRGSQALEALSLEVGDYV